MKNQNVSFVMGGAGFWFVFLSGFVTATVLLLGLGASVPATITNFDPATEEEFRETMAEESGAEFQR